MTEANFTCLPLFKRIHTALQSSIARTISRYIKNAQTVVLQYIVWKSQNIITYIDVNAASLQINKSKDYKAIMS